VSPGPSDRERREQEAIVNRLLRDLPYADPTLSGEDRERSQGPGKPAGPARPARPEPRRTGAAWLWTLLGLVAGAAVPFWPYARGCGWWLGAYGAVVAVVLVVALRAVRVTWRERVGAAHALAFLVLLWGLTLGAELVLPRVGYAGVSAGWRCAPPAMPTPQKPDSAGT
jgi:hypothetical protein